MLQVPSTVDVGHLAPPYLPYTPIVTMLGDPKWCKISFIHNALNPKPKTLESCRNSTKQDPQGPLGCLAALSGSSERQSNFLVSPDVLKV